MCRPVNALFLYPDISVPGGVVEYVETIRRYLPEKISFTHFPIGSKSGTVGKFQALLKPIVDSFTLLKLLQRHRIDVAVLNPSFNTKSVIRDGLFLLLCRVIGNVPVSVQFHGWDLKLSKEFAKSRWKRQLFSRVYGCAEDIAVLSSEIEKELLSLGFEPKKVRTYHTVFDGESFRPTRKKQFDRIDFLFISRFIKAKGIRNLLRAFAKLSSEEGDVCLNLAGNGPEIDWIKKYIMDHELADKVHLLGYVKGEEKTSLFWKSNVFVLPSDSEGFPVSMLEAMASGNVVAITNVGCVPDIIEQGRNGFIMKDNSVEAILDVMRKVVDDKNMLRSCSKINSSQAWGKYEAADEAVRVANRICALAAG